jgi:hypothetical protein
MPDNWKIAGIASGLFLVKITNSCPRKRWISIFCKKWKAKLDF